MKKTFWLCLVMLISFQFNAYSQKDSITYNIVNLKVNDENDHFGISFYEENKIVFTSNLLDKKGRQELINGTPHVTLYQGEINEEGDIINVSLLPKKIESSVFNLSASTFYNSDKKYLLVTTNVYNSERNENLEQKASKLRIEMGEYVAGVGWSNFKVPSFCNPAYSYGHPAISPDGEYMYFASNMRGSVGGTDIFRVKINENNVFGKPENLGPNVNTRKKELFPFVGKDNVLYFSSNRPRAIGRMDIYSSEILEDGTFEAAKLLETPINSRFDDYSFKLNDDLQSGYFTSKRPNGKGGDDLYYFTKNKIKTESAEELDNTINTEELEKVKDTLNLKEVKEVIIVKDTLIVKETKNLKKMKDSLKIKNIKEEKPENKTNDSINE